MSAAAESAAREAELWVTVVRLTPSSPREGDITGLHSLEDLNRRSVRWGHQIVEGDLGEVCLFAAGLATAESEAWIRDDPTVATRAHEDRRFLAGDRVLWWAVPWAFGSVPEAAYVMLDLGEQLRVAPALAAHEGLVWPGEDSLGPVEPDRPYDDWLGSVLSGAVLGERSPTAALYLSAAEQWDALAASWKGTASFWMDMSTRARATSLRLSAR